MSVSAKKSPTSRGLDDHVTENDGDLVTQPSGGTLFARWWTIVRVAAFAFITCRLTFPQLSRIHSAIAGNPGDAFLIFALLRWGGQRSTSLSWDTSSGLPR